MNKIRITPQSGGYDVMIGSGILARSGKLISDMLDDRNKRVLIVSDDHVAPLWLSKLTDSLKKVGVSYEIYIIPNGESSKNIDNYIKIIQTLEHYDFCRSNAVVALGGGVVGDLSGFAAATFQRGMGFIQIPTTIMAAVDSSVGGKTAVNLESGKNLLGAFYQPWLVLCDTDTFKTLPTDVVRDGCAEVLKYGVLANEGLFNTIVDSHGRVAALNEDVIAKCVSIKKHYVEKDEFDHGMRQYLNLGHTIGHAIEACSHYEITHGSAVASGMVIATRIALKLEICDPDCPMNIIEGIRSVGFDVNTSYNADELMQAIRHDKKRSGGNINMILPKRVGECLLHTMTLNNLEKVLKEVVL